MVTLAPSYTKGPPTAQMGSGGNVDGAGGCWPQHTALVGVLWSLLPAPATTCQDGLEAGTGDTEVPFLPPQPTAPRTFSDQLAYISRLLCLLLHQRLDLLHEVADLL